MMQCVDCSRKVSAGAQRCRPCRAKVQRRLALATSPNVFVCEHCARPALRQLGGRNLKNGSLRRWCCMACRSAAARRLHDEVKALRRIQHNNRFSKPPRSWADRYRERYAATWEQPRSCGVCGTAFLKQYGQGALRAFCSDACAGEARRRWKRAEKSKRRAQMRGLPAQAIDPIAVFERDRWRCHLCARSVRRAFRGSTDDLAPELDHVVPLAQGGRHVWDNVALAHRICNQRKSDSVRGQLMLEAFARP